jgi:TolA-binding protein
MSTRTINRLAVLWLSLCVSPSVFAGGEYEEARLNAGDQARNLAVSAEVEALIRQKETEVADKRHIGIKLLENYLREHKPGSETGEVLFQLAELRWEESKSRFLSQMALYNSAVERCAQEREKEQAASGRTEAKKRKKGGGSPASSAVHCQIPNQPTLDLTASEGLYRRLLAEYPGFRKTDAVLYLYGFSLRSAGHTAEALVLFRRIIGEHPHSRFLPDAWMAVAESRFYEDSDYRSALAGYEEVLKYPDSPLYDLSLFKSAWCFWKLGDPDRAARRFKEVLDLGSGTTSVSTARAHHLTEQGKKRLAELKSEALEYLVQVFTEDERKGPKDAFDFLTSIGGAAYSRKVLAKLADTFYVQARYERAIESERFLITLDPNDEQCPDHDRRIVEAMREMDDPKGAVKEMRHLAETYGPGSDWARAQQSKEAVKHAHDIAAVLLRDTAKLFHSDAQRNEALSHHIDTERYGKAAEAYAYYLSKFGSDEEAVEVHYLLGDIYLLKLKKNEEAGDAYLAVGKSRPLGKLHREALLGAINAFEKVRRDRAAQTGKQLLPSDHKMGEAIDLYVNLFPNDKEMADVLFKNGELFYDYGDYDEAVKRFGLIVEKYPKNPAAQAAGDKILESLNRAKDYENIESWARRLLKVPAFQGKADQERLGRLVIDSGMKAGEKRAEKDPTGAATIYLRVAAEFPQSSRAPQALTNAAVTYGRAALPEEAVKIYAQLVEKYPNAPETPAAAWAAGRFYEQAALWDQAARYYQLLAARYPNDGKAADALYNAGLLREHLGDAQGAIAAYGEYARRFRSRDDASRVAFRIGLVLADAGQKDAAAHAFSDFVRAYPVGADAVSALEHEGEMLLAAGHDKRADESLKKAITLYRKMQGKERTPIATHAAAHARYLEGESVFHEFERHQLAADPKRLKKTLDEKSALLEKSKQIFIDVVTFNDPEWATAALFRIGEAYERFAKALREAPVPSGLSAEEQQIYREELEKVVVVVEEKALDSYKGGYKKALDLTVYNDFTQKLRQALGRMSDQEFPPEAEARTRPAPAEVHTTLPFVSSVRR